jgi:hypothetical protein
MVVPDLYHGHMSINRHSSSFWLREKDGGRFMKLTVSRFKSGVTLNGICPTCAPSGYRYQIPLKAYVEVVVFDFNSTGYPRAAIYQSSFIIVLVQVQTTGRRFMNLSRGLRSRIFGRANLLYSHTGTDTVDRRSKIKQKLSFLQNSLKPKQPLLLGCF